MKIVIASDVLKQAVGDKELPVIGSTDKVPFALVRMRRGVLRNRIAKLETQIAHYERHSDDTSKFLKEECVRLHELLSALNEVKSIHSRKEYLHYLSLVNQ